MKNQLNRISQYKIEGKIFELDSITKTLIHNLENDREAIKINDGLCKKQIDIALEIIDIIQGTECFRS